MKSFGNIAMAAVLAAPVGAAADGTGTIAVSGIDYWYEVSGEGPPLLVLHGGLGSSDMFDPIMPVLGEGREVITVDLQGHGRTTLGDRDFAYPPMAEDLSAIISELGYEEVDVFGYSFGGALAIRLAIQHPEQVGRVVAVSAGFARDGIFPEILAMQEMVGAEIAPSMEGTPMLETYRTLAPDPEAFPQVLDQMGQLMANTGDWSDEIALIEDPVMLVYGDADMVMPEHAVEFFHLLGGGLRDGGWMREGMSENRLAILPGRTHYDIFLSPELARLARPFLDDAEEIPDWEAPQ